MSYGAMMAGPPPAGDRRCPYCDAPIKPGKTDVCWLCLEKLSVREGMPDLASPKMAAPFPRRELPADQLGWAVFGVLALIISGAMAFTAPGILVSFIVVATPALVRTIITSQRKADDMSIALPPSFLRLFLSSLGVAVFVGVAAQAAFVAACFAFGFAGLGLAGGGEKGIGLAIIAGGLAGTVAWVAVTIWLFRRFWSRPH